MKVVEQQGRPIWIDSKGQPYQAVPRWLNSLGDSVVKLGHGRGGPFEQVSNETDWQVIAGLVDLYATFFPQSWKDFVKDNKVISSAQANRHGLIADKGTKKGGEAQIRQLGQWPFELEVMIKTIWPNQKFNKDFLRGFMKRLPVFKTVDKI